MILQDKAFYKLPIMMFRGKYNYLSNFYYAPFTFTRVRYLTVESAYQSMKATNREERACIIVASPAKAKQLGSKVKFTVEQVQKWNKNRIRLMYYLVKAKFRDNKYIREKLIATGDLELVEGNYWGDKYWGVDNKSGMGENYLGKLLMEVRKEWQ